MHTEALAMFECVLVVSYFVVEKYHSGTPNDWERKLIQLSIHTLIYSPVSYQHMSYVCLRFSLFG